MPCSPLFTWRSSAFHAPNPATAVAGGRPAALHWAAMRVTLLNE